MKTMIRNDLNINERKDMRFEEIMNSEINYIFFSLYFVPNHVAIAVTATMIMVIIGWFAGWAISLTIITRPITSTARVANAAVDNPYIDIIIVCCV